jgi:hypothetical protein
MFLGSVTSKQPDRTPSRTLHFLIIHPLEIGQGPEQRLTLLCAFVGILHVRWEVHIDEEWVPQAQPPPYLGFDDGMPGDPLQPPELLELQQPGDAQHLIYNVNWLNNTHFNIPAPLVFRYQKEVNPGQPVPAPIYFRHFNLIQQMQASVISGPVVDLVVELHPLE